MLSICHLDPKYVFIFQSLQLSTDYCSLFQNRTWPQIEYYQCNHRFNHTGTFQKPQTKKLLCSLVYIYLGFLSVLKSNIQDRSEQRKLMFSLINLSGISFSFSFVIFYLQWIVTDRFEMRSDMMETQYQVFGLRFSSKSQNMNFFEMLYLQGNLSILQTIVKLKQPCEVYLSF